MFWKGIELRNLLSDSTGLELPSAMLYENPSIALISAFVGSEIDQHYIPSSAAQQGRIAQADEYALSNKSGDSGQDISPEGHEVRYLIDACLGLVCCMHSLLPRPRLGPEVN